MLLVIDNYDSFTYNLVQYFSELGEDVQVFRNDEITLEGVERLNPARIVVSPGPCTPNEAGISVSAITHFAGKVPILGVCLGHQSIGQAFGGKIVHAKQLMHGKTSAIQHHDSGVFTGLPAGAKVFIEGKEIEGTLAKLPKAVYNYRITAPSFEQVAALAEAVTLAGIALRVPYKRLLWDATKVEFTNSTEATALVRRAQYRQGWQLVVEAGL